MTCPRPIRDGNECRHRRRARELNAAAGTHCTRPVPPRSLRIEARSGESHRSQLDLDAFRPFRIHRYPCHLSAMTTTSNAVMSSNQIECVSAHR